jgi:outer membrane lipoprotein SlyB
VPVRAHPRSESTRRLQASTTAADVLPVDRRVIWLCVGAGSTVGGLIPEAWGGSAFGVGSLLLGVLGAVAGLWLGARLTT